MVGTASFIGSMDAGGGGDRPQKCGPPAASAAAAGSRRVTAAAAAAWHTIVYRTNGAMSASTEPRKRVYRGEDLRWCNLVVWCRYGHTDADGSLNVRRGDVIRQRRQRCDQSDGDMRSWGVWCGSVSGVGARAAKSRAARGSLECTRACGEGRRRLTLARTGRACAGRHRAGGALAWPLARGRTPRSRKS